jgi:hypothetical protein
MEKICVCEDLDERIAIQDEIEMWERDLESLSKLKQANRMLEIYNKAGITRKHADWFTRVMRDLNYDFKQLRKYWKEGRWSRGHRPSRPTLKDEEAFKKVGLSAEEQAELFFILDQVDYWYSTEKKETIDKILKGTGYTPRVRIK